MSTAEAILQGIRAWIKAELALNDAGVIPADSKGPRPPLPYLTVKVVVSDVPIGSDATSNGINGFGPTVKATGQRRATVAVRGFGAQTSEWLETLLATMILPRAQASLNAAGLSLVPIGGLQDLARLLDTSFEGQYLREFDAFYRVETAIQQLVELETVTGDLSLERYPDHPDALQVDLQTP